MRSMQISKKSFLGRVYLALTNRTQTDICHFGFMTFVIAPVLGFLLIVVPGALLVVFGAVIYNDPIGFVFGILMAFGIMALFGVPAFSVVYFSKPTHFTVFKAWIRAKKERYCTKLEIV